MMLPGFHISWGTVCPFYYLVCEQQKQNKYSKHLACLHNKAGQIKNLAFMRSPSWPKRPSIILAILSLCGRVTWQQAEKAGAELLPKQWLGMAAFQGKCRRGHAAVNKPDLIRERALVTHITQTFRLPNTKMQKTNTKLKYGLILSWWSISLMTCKIKCCALLN